MKSSPRRSTIIGADGWAPFRRFTSATDRGWGGAGSAEAPGVLDVHRRIRARCDGHRCRDRARQEAGAKGETHQAVGPWGQVDLEPSVRARMEAGDLGARAVAYHDGGGHRMRWTWGIDPLHRAGGADF